MERFCPQRPERLIVGGGGSMNPVLLAHIADCLPGCQVLTNEQLGLDSSAKEAVAFAVLANRSAVWLRQQRARSHRRRARRGDGENQPVNTARKGEEVK